MTFFNIKSFIIGLFIGIILIYFLIEIKNRCFLRTSSKDKLNEIIKILVRQASRWTTAAKQDKNILIAVLHSNYGTGYLWALKDIATDDEIKAAMNIDVHKFEKKITEIQDYTTKRLAMACEKFAPDSNYLSRLAGEGV